MSWTSTVTPTSVYLCLIVCLGYKVPTEEKKEGVEPDLVQQFLLFDMEQKMMRMQLYIPSADYFHTEKTDEVIYSVALNVTKCIGSQCAPNRFGWSVRTYADIENTHQEDFLNMITVNIAQLVYGSPQLFSLNIMDEFFRAHSKVDRVLQLNLQPLIITNQQNYLFGLKDFGTYQFDSQ